MTAPALHTKSGKAATPAVQGICSFPGVGDIGGGRDHLDGGRQRLLGHPAADHPGRAPGITTSAFTAVNSLAPAAPSAGRTAARMRRRAGGAARAVARRRARKGLATHPATVETPTTRPPRLNHLTARPTVRSLPNPSTATDWFSQPPPGPARSAVPPPPRRRWSGSAAPQRQFPVHHRGEGRRCRTALTQQLEVLLEGADVRAGEQTGPRRPAGGSPPAGSGPSRPPRRRGQRNLPARPPSHPPT